MSEISVSDLIGIPNASSIQINVTVCTSVPLVDGLVIHGAQHLLDVVQAMLPGDAAQSTPLPRAKAELRPATMALPDLREVKGQAR